MSFRIPGSFPSNFEDNPVIPNNDTNATASNIIEHQDMAKFSGNQSIYKKTKNQYELISQIDSLCYILIFYQFIKFCHSACLIPLVLQVLTHTLLNSKILTNRDNASILSFLTTEQDQSLRSTIVNNFLHRYCYLIYIKTAFVMLYHTLFVCLWEVSISKSNNLPILANGTWWFVSFIGEQVPMIDRDSSMGARVLKLSLLQLLFTDLLILFLQLVLYQCIFKQSDVLHLERKLNEEEVYIIRTNVNGASSIQESNEELNVEIPTVLKIRLFEVFQSEQYCD